MTTQNHAAPVAAAMSLIDPTGYGASAPAAPRKQKQAKAQSRTDSERLAQSQRTEKPRSQRTRKPRKARSEVRSENRTDRRANQRPARTERPAAIVRSAVHDANPDATPAATGFAELGVPDALVSQLTADGKTAAFPIQVATLPDTLAGRDVLGRGRTGSGKTLAFSIPLVARLAGSGNAPHRPKALVLAPTRELASQIAGVIEPLAQRVGLRVTTVFGGVKQTRQERELDRGAAIVVACPGRLEDLMGQGVLTLADVEVTVIDEADLMADMGFLPGVTRILNATPQGGQRMLFSATLDNGVDKLVRKFLHNPVQHAVDSAESPVEKMTHHIFEVRDQDQKKALVEALAAGQDRSILFFRTKHRAKRTARQLTGAGIPTVDLQGNLSQAARDRNLAAFDSGAVRSLAATDVAARGVDVPDVGLVIHADPPTEHKAYLHRSGRTARAGHAGDVVTICLPEERRDLAATLKKAGIRVRPVSVTASSPEVAELVGDVAPRVSGAALAAAMPSAPQQQARKGRGKGSSSNGGGGGRGRKKPAVAKAQQSREGRGGQGGQKRSARGSGAKASAAAGGRGRAHSAAAFSGRRRGR